ncbi:MAG: hypothetical protein COA78_00875 [Blastopirellula sp.]|nr:MAG: hypothetical protein COA78_00875 [Blastopirellula sp.]
MAKEARKNVLTVDGKEYDTDSISDNARKIAQNIQMADQELIRLQAVNAMAQTARQAYVKALKAELEKPAAEETASDS